MWRANFGPQAPLWAVSRVSNILLHQTTDYYLLGIGLIFFVILYFVILFDNLVKMSFI